MSLVTYNGISLPYPLTTSFSQDTVYDDEGNVDWCGTKYSIVVQCIINLQYLEAMAAEFGSVTTGNASTVMNLIRIKLEEPRKTLSFKNGGVDLIPPKAGVTGTVDIRNGPQPLYCRIVEMNSETFLMNYAIEAVYWEKYPHETNRTTNQQASPVMYNRWSETIEIDEMLMSRRTREGKYIIRSDNAQGLTADEVRRSMAVLAVPTGFVRKVSRYTITPDGLGIRYQIVDEEVYKLPPQPAYKASGHYVIASPKPGGVICYGEVRLRLEGAKSKSLSPQSKLVTVAVALAAGKLGINGASQLQSVSITTDLFQNIVEVHMRALMNAQQARYEGVTLAKAFANNLTFTPGSDNKSQKGTGPTYLPRGTASLLLQAAAYYDPNVSAKLGRGTVAILEDNNPIPILASQMVPGLIPGQAGQQVED